MLTEQKRVRVEIEWSQEDADAIGCVFVETITDILRDDVVVPSLSTNNRVPYHPHSELLRNVIPAGLWEWIQTQPIVVIVPDEILNL